MDHSLYLEHNKEKYDKHSQFFEGHLNENILKQKSYLWNPNLEARKNKALVIQDYNALYLYVVYLCSYEIFTHFHFSHSGFGHFLLHILLFIPIYQAGVIS